MADLFIDCEWIGGEYMTILGAYSPGQSRFQLYDETLTRNRFSRFLNLCRNRSSHYTFLFCHGPDIGRTITEFKLKLKKNYYCINTVTAFKKFTQFRNRSLGHLEQCFGLPREHVLTPSEMSEHWDSRNWRKRRIVLEYNWEDCMNLWRLVNRLKTDYDVTRSDFKSISMNP